MRFLWLSGGSFLLVCRRVFVVYQKLYITFFPTSSGKEFRAVFISTVRTALTCQDFHLRGKASRFPQQPYWEFLSDATLLNTAITRAKSLVAVVGDPVSLCTVGECRGIWRDYIKRCSDRKALYGTSFEELKEKISLSLSKISLNPQAATFVPKSTSEGSKQDCQSVDGSSAQQDSEEGNLSSLEVPKIREHGSAIFPIAEGNQNNPMTNDAPESRAFKEELMQKESYDEDEDKQEEDDSLLEKIQNSTPSDYEEQNGIQETFAFFDEFRRDSLEDETVFPKYMDKIIKALVEKCKQTKQSEEAFPSLQAAKTTKKKTFKTENHAANAARQEKPVFSSLSSADYQIYHINGRKMARLVTVEFQQKHSSRVQRLTTSLRQQDYLDVEILQRHLHKQPEKYLSCTLRLNSESFRSAYGVVSDTKTPDIKIKGRVRSVFDMDRVVIKKTDGNVSSRDDVLRSQGHIVGKFQRAFLIRCWEHLFGAQVDIN